MASVRSLGIATSLTLSLAGCVRGPAVRADGTVQLRRVVIYRNGVGYFERHGRTAREGLEFRVRESDVGDFLATLAVMDSGGGAVRAAAFPSSPSAERNATSDARRTVRLAVDGGREVSVGYTVEAPIWRPSYRLVYDGHGGARLQVWGLVQNHSGEDWRDVRLSLVAGAPVAFRADLANARTAPRPTVTDEGEVIQGVPHGDTALAQSEGDRDGDGIPDSVDVCPSEGEDRDGLEDTDGCPEPDNDHDRVADAVDRCPNEPEVYNGTEDDDGCPDRGAVLVLESQIRILQTISFESGRDRIRHETIPIVDAIAQTVIGNPQITRVEIDGHADASEHRNGGGSVDTLAIGRARVVFDALVARGVPSARLTQRYTIDHPSTDHAHARRVEFHVHTADDAPEGAPSARNFTPPAPVSFASARTIAPSTTPPRNVAALAAIATMGAATRYDLPGAVTIPNGSASMVLLASVPLRDDRLYLFAPDDHVTASATHPFQIARFRNPTGGLLENGPVALFDTGTFLGQGLLEPLPVNAMATIPFAIERGVVVESTSARSTEGSRLLRMHRDSVVIERNSVTRTTYTVRNGIGHSVRVLVRHRLSEGVDLASPPNGTERAEGAALVPIEVRAESRVEQPVQTRVPFSMETRLDDELAVEAVEGYLRDGHPADDVAARLRTALDLRRQSRALAHERTVLEARRYDLTRSADETRSNLVTIERSRGAADLRGQLAARLARTATDLDALTRRAVEIDVEAGELRVRFMEALREIDVDTSR